MHGFDAVTIIIYVSYDVLYRQFCQQKNYHDYAKNMDVIIAGYSYSWIQCIQYKYNWACLKIENCVKYEDVMAK